MPLYYSPIRIYCQSASHRAIQWSTFLFVTWHIYWFDPKYVLCKFVCYYNAIIMWKRKKKHQYQPSTHHTDICVHCTCTHIEQTSPTPLKLINFLVLGMQNTYEATQMHLWKIFATPFICHALNQISTKNKKKCTKINRKIASEREGTAREKRFNRLVKFGSRCYIVLNILHVYALFPEGRSDAKHKNLLWTNCAHSLGLAHFYFRIQQLIWLFCSFIFIFQYLINSNELKIHNAIYFWKLKNVKKVMNRFK